jgi:hypothetical protein
MIRFPRARRRRRDRPARLTVPPLAALPLALWAWSASAMDTLRIDDFRDPAGTARSDTSWRLVTDQDMGGVSEGGLRPETRDGVAALCLRGDVRLENNGGFVQMARDLAAGGDLDASGFDGIRLRVYGNGETYGLHLKTADIRFPWQSYRAAFAAPPAWREIRLPFAAFEAHRVEAPLDVRRLRRLGLVAIGRAFAAELCLAEIAFYRDGG